MKIKDLPFTVILELCSYLDNPTLPHQSWRGLLAKAPGEGEKEDGGREGGRDRNSIIGRILKSSLETKISKSVCVHIEVDLNVRLCGKKLFALHIVRAQTSARHILHITYTYLTHAHTR